MEGDNWESLLRPQHGRQEGGEAGLLQLQVGSKAKWVRHGGDRELGGSAVPGLPSLMRKAEDNREQTHRAGQLWSALAKSLHKLTILQGDVTVAVGAECVAHGGTEDDGCQMESHRPGFYITHQ